MADKTRSLWDLFEEAEPGLFAEINLIWDDADKLEERLRELIPHFVSLDDTESKILLDVYVRKKLNIPGGYNEFMEGGDSGEAER